MKATFEYELPEEQELFDTAARAMELRWLFDDLLNEIRSATKHDCGELAKCDPRSLEIIRTYIVKNAQERDIPL